MKLKKVVLSFVFFCTATVIETSFILGATGKISIEREGRPPTSKELAWARTAFSIDLTEVRVSPTVEYVGFKANPVVNAAAAVAAYKEGEARPYLFRMFLPKKINPKKKYPLILLLHGNGESLSDNESQLAHMQTSIDVLAGPDRPDFYLVAVQCPAETHSWDTPDPRAPNGETPLEMLEKITQVLVEDHPVDDNRISLLGICTGGVAGFEMIKKFPKRFSAFAACSSDVPDDSPRIYRHLPIWLFNNQDDFTMWRSNLDFAAAVNKAWGNMDITLHEKGGHNTWTSAQRDDHIIEWLLRQRRGRFAFPRHAPALDHPEKEILLLFILPIAIFIFFVAASLIKVCRNLKRIRAVDSPDCVRPDSAEHYDRFR